MQIAFVGNENKISVYSKIIQNALLASQDAKSSICGVFSQNIETTANLALEINTKAYISLDDIIEDADIIFVCQPDSSLVAFSEYIKEKRIKGKIFCHFGSKYDSAVLSCGITNTCYSMSFPYTFLSLSDFRSICVCFEGEGKRAHEFEAAMKAIFPKAVFCSRSDKRLASIASRVLTDYIKVVVNMSIKFFKFSGLYDEESFCALASHSIKDAMSSHSLCKLKRRSESEVKKDLRLLTAINYTGTKDFYKSMEAYIAVNDTSSVTSKKEFSK